MPEPAGAQNGMFVAVGTQCCAPPHPAVGLCGSQFTVPLPVELIALLDATEVDATLEFALVELADVEFALVEFALVELADVVFAAVEFAAEEFAEDLELVDA